MIVKSIKSEKKHLTLVSFSNESEILLDNDTVSENSICVGTEIDEQFLSELKFDSDFRRAKSRALWYLDRMDYTEKALYEKLLKAGFSKKASASVLGKLCELGLVDDRRFAERLAERLIESNTSKREALHKMLLKGVPYDMAKDVLSETETDEELQITALLTSKYAYKLNLENGAQKVFAALVRKGFSYGGIRNAMKKYIEEQDFCEEY